MPVVGSTTILQPLTTVDGGEEFKIGEKNIIEELCLIQNSNIGDFNLIEVKATIKNSAIGSNTIIRSGAHLENCSVVSRLQFNWFF